MSSASSRFSSHRAAVVSAWFLGALALLCFGAPVLSAVTGLDPYAIAPGKTYLGPGAGHWLGTDDLGRDVLIRLLYGGRISLTVGLVAAAASIVIGGAVGLLAGYVGGVVDALLMRLTEAMMSVPRLPLMIMLLAVDLDKLVPGLDVRLGASGAVIKVIAIVVLFGWMSAARIARASAIELSQRSFVLAARATGATPARIVIRHILPNAVAPLIVAATLDVGQIIIAESVLSYLGIGVQPPMPSWGAMLKNGMSYLYSAPVLLIVPGVLTFATVTAVNFVGDGLRDALDPRV